MARRDKGRNRYERTDRVGELLREIIAEELIRIDDDRLQMVTVSGVEVDNELYQATVFLSALDLEDGIDLEAIDRHRNRLKKAINNQSRLRATPRLRFAVDPGVIQGNRVDELLRENREAVAERSQAYVTDEHGEDLQGEAVGATSGPDASGDEEE